MGKNDTILSPGCRGMWSCAKIMFETRLLSGIITPFVNPEVPDVYDMMQVSSLSHGTN
jgi:hypothetical protein